jgi:hypothetical protein
MRPLGSRNATFWVARSWQTVYPTAVGHGYISRGAMSIESLPKRLPAAQGSGVEVLC